MTFNNGNGDLSIDFRICSYVTDRVCPSNKDSYANLVNVNNTCYDLTSSSLSNVVVDLIDERDPD